MDILSQKYFITFIDDYSRYMYMHLLHTSMKHWMPSKSLRQLRSNNGGEYYGRYIENGQALGPFAKFLQEHEIVA